MLVQGSQAGGADARVGILERMLADLGAAAQGQAPTARPLCTASVRSASAVPSAAPRVPVALSCRLAWQEESAILDVEHAVYEMVAADLARELPHAQGQLLWKLWRWSVDNSVQVAHPQCSCLKHDSA